MSGHYRLAAAVLLLILNDQAHTGRIIGGREAVPHSRPYMALLEMLMQNGQTKYCGGFLLNEDFVMTAAHCQAKSYTVLLGVHNSLNIHEKRQNISVEQAFPNRNYNKNSFNNDIMLLKLSSKAQFNEYVKPLALAERDNGSLPEQCIVSGWGRSHKDTIYLSTVLLEVNVTLIDYKLCTMERFYCSQGKTGPAEGDSGGPLVCEDGKAFGVVSSNFKPSSGGPTIYRYAKIPENNGWIKWTMTQHGSIH
ncbi:granzyme B-like [Betta splendens]|uniref:trypsin n=1 Tax=Betta splendens TaxID=158456 RepID=A0A6P7MFK8_BETSP|nr:granzyme B-like [Betta splendens]